MTRTDDANTKHSEPGMSPTSPSEGRTVDEHVQRSGGDQDVYSENQSNPDLVISRLGRALIGSVGRVDAACDKVLRLGSTGIVRMAIVIATVLGALIALMTFIQVIADLSSLREDRAARRDEAIQKAWERLITPSAGNIGKGAALNVLFNNGVSLINADFSCDVVGSWDAASSTCLRRPIFDSVRFAARPTYLSGAWPFNSLEVIANAITGIDDTPPSEEFGAFFDVTTSQFSTVIGHYGEPSPGLVKLAASGLAMRGAILNFPFWEDLSLKAVDLSNAWIMNGWLSFIRMVGQFYETNIVDTDLSSSVIEGRLNDMRVTRSNVSKTLFVSYTTGLDAFGIPKFVNAWAWADSPPLVAFKSDGSASAAVTSAAIESLPELYKQIVLCDPTDRASTEGTSDGYLELLKYTHHAKMTNLPEPKERWAISGIRPRMKEPSSSESTPAKPCNQMAWEVATDLYPGKYRFQSQPQVLIEEGLQIAPKPQAKLPPSHSDP